MRAPVDNALAAVDKPFFIKVAEHLVDRLAAALIEREALTVPVAGRAHFLKLFDNSAAVLRFPRPSALQEFFAADVLFG